MRRLVHTGCASVAFATGIVACGEGVTSAVPSDLDLAAEVVVDGLIDPVALTAPAGDPRLFVAEQGGRILVIEDGSLRSTPFLDISGLVSGGSEQGLLGLAFHPSYRSNGFFYVDYTERAGGTRVVRYSVSSDPNVANAGSASTVLTVSQPHSNHNGGAIMFGPDGYLYIGLGDGGSAGDPDGYGQDSTSFLGSVLRIDVDGGAPYAIPSDNPFAGHPDARREVWAYGLRNPWRFSIDWQSDMVYIGDVGQGAWEEIDAVPRSSANAYNFGWNTMEGLECFQSATCTRSGLTLPVAVYATDDGCAVVGGHVYRGDRLAGLAGTYFYADYCTGSVKSLSVTNGTAGNHMEWQLGNTGSVLSFGEDAAGELYLLSESTVYRIVEAP